MFSTANIHHDRTADRVGSAIRQASARTGVDFSYLLNQAKIESGLDPTARARTSSATGLYQFIEQTWLATVRKHGGAHGLGWAAAAIEQGADGRYRVADGETRRAILDLRNEPEAASAMAAAFASDNRTVLEERLSRPVEGVDLYLAHFLGPEGAASFLGAHDARPDEAAATLFPAAAAANRAVFFQQDGTPRSFADIRRHFAAKFDDAGATPTLYWAARTSAPTLAAPSPHYARLAYLMLAELGA